MEELLAIVRSIPPGKVASYSDVGQAMQAPISGFLVGRMLGRLKDQDAPWWRVVARDGKLPISKKAPTLESVQMARLRDEGVTIIDGQVEMDRHRHIP